MMIEGALHASPTTYIVVLPTLLNRVGYNLKGFIFSLIYFFFLYRKDCYWLSITWILGMIFVSVEDTWIFHVS